ncbi:MAG: WecB/TagA/CpsF family glycosyltransferase [Candidatus Riflebacteria bacterium]|nr:WecB/TagA/CpsF family glycosyltransferase [Candidatus Riflebacteria bacterium]
MNLVRILGLSFFSASVGEAAKHGLSGGLTVVPSAPSLVRLVDDRAYRNAMTHADTVLTDSGFMVLLWNLLHREKIVRVSGLVYLSEILSDKEFRCPGHTFWIMPHERAVSMSIEWLATRGISINREDSYIAPRYADTGPIEDTKVLELIAMRRPSQIVVALGGGVQEKLGWYLRQHLDYVPGIHCIGAAIGFLSGDQVYIPRWADSLFLGWLLRCLYRPDLYVPRYIEAWRLFPLIVKFRDRLPPFRNRDIQNKKIVDR